MMLHLEDLSLRGGERFERNYSLELAPVVLGGVGYEVLLPRGVDVAVDRITGGFMVNVSLDARVYGACSRCLRETVLELHAEQQEFAPTTKGGWEESELSAFIKDLVVDVAGLAREAMVLALPAQIVCREACKGLCAHCGCDLNQGECGCAPALADERWSKLRDLQLGIGDGENESTP
jgi:uncharacterized protein